MENITTNYGLTHRSICLANVLWFGVSWLRSAFIILACMWALVALVDSQSGSVGFVVGVMLLPVLLQLAVIMFIAMRASQLLMNPQLHLIGIRKEIFINCFFVCLLFSVFIYDPKSADNLIIAKLIMFAIFSTSCFWLIWFYSLQILPMFIVALIFSVSIWIAFGVGIKLALSVFNISTWVYFAFWLSRSPLQRQFKFESFSGLVDYFVERLNLAGLKRLVTKVNNKYHAVLMGEGDGYINRIFLSQFFGLLFTAFYIVAVRNLRELCLWMILLILLGGKARIKVMQSQAKIWLLHDGNRHSQFKITEGILLRLHAYPLLVSFMLLMFWSYLNPNLIAHGLGALLLSALFVVALDYCSGFIFQGAKFSSLIFIFVKMGFMSAMVFMHFNPIGYLMAATVILGVCALARNRAKRIFLVANLSARAT